MKIQKEKLKSRNRGITLIALVITIIVLLILAGISISMLSGDNSILQRATEAKKVNIEVEEKEAVSIAYNSCLVATLGKDVEASELEKTLKNDGYNVSVNGEDELTVIFKDTKNVYTITQDGILNKEDDYMEPTGVYSFLCDTNGDGEGDTLVLSSKNEIKGYVIIKNYGDNEAYQKDENNATKVGSTIYHYPIWYNDRTLIQKVENYDNISPTTMECWFYGCTNATSIDLSKINTVNVTNMCFLFRNCKNVTKLDVKGFNTKNVTNLKMTFAGCSALMDLDVSGFKTNKVTNMNATFFGCEQLEKIDVSGFDTKNVTSMYAMFSGCKKVKKLDLINFNTEKVPMMSQMFKECESLTILDLSNFNTRNMKKMGGMFSECTNLKTIYASNLFSLESLTDSMTGGVVTDCFSSCASLVGGNGTTMNIDNVYKVGPLFARIDGGPESDTPGFFTYKEPSR